MQNLRKVDKKDGSIFSRLWTKVREILRQFGQPFAVSNYVTSYFVPKIFVVKFAVTLRRRRKTFKILFWVPILGEGISQISYSHFQICLTSEHATKFG